MTGSGQCAAESATGDKRTDAASRDWRRRAVNRGRPHFPSPKVARPLGSARRGGARGEVARPARAAILPPPPAAGRGTERSRRGRGGGAAGGAATDTEAARKAHHSSRGGGRQPRVNTRPSAPAGGGDAGSPRSPRGGKAGNPRGYRVRSARAKLAAPAPPRRLLPPLPALRSPLLASPTPPSSDSSRVPPGCSPCSRLGRPEGGGVRSTRERA